MMKTISKQAKTTLSILLALQYVFVPMMVFAEDATSQQVEEPLMGNSSNGKLPDLDERRAEMEKRREERRKLMEERRNKLEARQDERQDERQEMLQDASCDRILSVANTMLQHRKEKNDRIAERVADHGLYNEERRNNLIAKWSDTREKYDEARNKMYDKLNESAETDEQKEAVKDFVNAVDRAVSERRADIDAAVQSFQADVDKLVSSKKKSSSDIASSFETSMEEAIETAKNECDSNTDPKTVRENLLGKMKAARENAVEERKGLESMKDEIQKLIDKRKNAIKAAREKFVDAVENAREDLKKSF